MRKNASHFFYKIAFFDRNSEQCRQLKDLSRQVYIYDLMLPREGHMVH